jgi:hypothetical protein
VVRLLTAGKGSNARELPEAFLSGSLCRSYALYRSVKPSKGGKKDKEKGEGSASPSE